MSAYKAWRLKQRGNPVLLIVAAVGFTASLFFSYKQFYSPWVARRRLTQSESFATALYEKENKPRD